MRMGEIMTSMRLKECKCGIVADDTMELDVFFHKDPAKRYGYSNLCKECTKIKNKKYREAKKVRKAAFEKQARQAYEWDAARWASEEKEQV